MKRLFSRVQWRSQVLNIAAMICSVLLLAVSLYFYLDSQKKLEISSAEFRSQLSQNQAAQSAKQLLDANADAFAELKARGVIGSAQRLQWIELTERISTALGILLVDFTLGKTTTASEMSTAYFNYDVKVSTTSMDFEISLRHEGEFFKFMEALRLNAKGLFSVNDCKILRNPVSAGANAELAGLSAKCQVQWYSIEDVSSDWELAQQ